MTIVQPAKVHSGAFLAHVIYDTVTPRLQPASVSEDGVVMTEWELTEAEQETLFMGGHVRLWFRLPVPLQQAIPVAISVLEPEA